LKAIPSGQSNNKLWGGRKTAPTLSLYQTQLSNVNAFSVIIHNFSDLHKFFLCILYNIPYCKTKKVVLSYSYKEKVLNDFSDAKKAHRWKAEIAEKPTDAKESIL
jgi:hypothetical protein